MPPEEPNALVAVRFDFDGPTLKGCGERVLPGGANFLRASWYTAPDASPRGYQPILDGVVFAYTPSVFQVIEMNDVRPTKRGDRYCWRDTAGMGGLMFAMILPAGHSIREAQPLAVEAKRFRDRIALFWLFFSRGGPAGDSVQVEWAFCPLDRDLDEEVEALNRQIGFASKRESATDYDVALSFAGEDRGYVEQVAEELQRAGVRVFYDSFEQHTLWGKNLYDHLSELYEKPPRFTVMFVSKAYAEKRWTNFERKAAQARAYSANREYILPARFDDTELPGVLPTTAYISLKEIQPTELARLIVKKLESSEG